MKKANSKSPNKAEQQTIEELQQRYQALNTKKIEAQTEFRNAKKRLEQLQEAARKEFGTDDIAELQRKLQEMKDENERKRAQYQEDLDGIEGDLAEIENRFAAAESAPEAEAHDDA